MNLNYATHIKAHESFWEARKHFWPITPNNNLKFNVAMSFLETGHNLGNKYSFNVNKCKRVTRVSCTIHNIYLLVSYTLTKWVLNPWVMTSPSTLLLQDEEVPFELEHTGLHYAQYETLKRLQLLFLFFFFPDNVGHLSKA